VPKVSAAGRANSKKAKALDLLRRPAGAAIDEIAKVMVALAIVLLVAPFIGHLLPRGLLLRRPGFHAAK
jgi:hypothetical protein